MQTSLYQLSLFFSLLYFVSVAASPISRRNDSTELRKFKDGLEVGPMAVVAESGSNVHIQNIFNIFLVRDAMSNEVIAQVAAQVAEKAGVEAPDKKPRPILVEAVVPRPKRIVSNSSAELSERPAPEAKNEEATQQLSPPGSISSSSTAASTSTSTSTSTKKPTTRAQAATSSASVSARSSASVSPSTSRAGANIKAMPQAGRDRPAAKSSSTAAPTTRTTARRAPAPESNSIEPVEQQPSAPSARRPAASAPDARARASGSAAARPTGDASAQAVDHSAEVQPNQPARGRVNRNRRANAGQHFSQSDADSGAEQSFVPEHVEHSFED